MQALPLEPSPAHRAGAGREAAGFHTRRTRPGGVRDLGSFDGVERKVA